MAQATAPVLDSTRREFIALLGGAAASLPLAAHAQQPERIRRIGVLMGYPEAQSEFASFVQELQKLGWAEGRNLRIDVRWGDTRRPGVDASLRERTRGLTARPHSFTKHTYYCGAVS
jgi:hypothetical protein